jgi:hypothetical protein
MHGADQSVVVVPQRQAQLPHAFRQAGLRESTVRPEMIDNVVLENGLSPVAEQQDQEFGRVVVKVHLGAVDRQAPCRGVEAGRPDFEQSRCMR